MNIDLKSKHFVVSGTPVNLGLEVVPDGMTRYITFVKLNNEHNGANAIFLCSGTTAVNAASGIAKDKQFFGAQYDTLAYPDKPSIDAPLYTIAASKYLTAFCSAGKMGLFIQYYDK